MRSRDCCMSPPRAPASACTSSAIRRSMPGQRRRRRRAPEPCSRNCGRSSRIASSPRLPMRFRGRRRRLATLRWIRASPGSLPIGGPRCDRRPPRPGSRRWSSRALTTRSSSRGSARPLGASGRSRTAGCSASPTTHSSDGTTRASRRRGRSSAKSSPRSVCARPSWTSRRSGRYARCETPSATNAAGGCSVGTVTPSPSIGSPCSRTAPSGAS